MRLTAWRSVAHRRGRPLRATHGPSQGRTIVDGGGFTLVEVLVALVVLAVGMLGLAVLLVDGLRGSRGAIEHTQAANLAADVAERMRSNRAAASAYDTADGTPDPSVEPACDDPAGPCDPLALASHDLRRWLDDVAATLPDGRGTVEVEHRAVESRRGIVTLHWTPAGESPANYTLVVDL